MQHKHFSLNLLLLVFYLICCLSLAIVLYFILLLPFSLCLTLSHCGAPMSRLPVRQRGPGGSNELNYWEHKNAAANGSWINTLAKLLLQLPLLPQGIKLETLRWKMRHLEATAATFSGAEPQFRHTRSDQSFGVQRDNLIMILVIYLTVETAWCKNWQTPLIPWIVCKCINLTLYTMLWET